MKKSFLPAFLLLFLALGMFSCQQGAKETTKEYPMFWTWLDYRPGMNFDSICQVMNDIGMDGIMLNAPTPDDYRAELLPAVRLIWTRTSTATKILTWRTSTKKALEVWTKVPLIFLTKKTNSDKPVRANNNLLQ